MAPVGLAGNRTGTREGLTVEELVEEILAGLRALALRAADDAREIARLHAECDRLTEENGRLTGERDKLQRFKDYVHARLDAAGRSRATSRR